ncbi:MAG: hypothetical protein HY658_12340, partial [Actinobacteria bacterium]|nr:hypothetical protein [Actinomycetota bacterium]
MRARRHTGSIVTLLLLGAACTGGVEPETRTTTAPPDRPLAGTVVGPSGIGSDGGRVVVHDLATGETRPIGGGGFEGRTFVNSVAVDADGRHYVVADTALGEFDPLFGGEFESRLYLLGADGAVERIGPPLPAVGSLVGIEDGVAIATACDEESPSVIALDLGRPEGWRPLGPGCVASLSPDGKHVAAAGQGEGSRDRVVRFATGEPGPAELLVDLASLEEIGSVAAIGDPRVEGIEWGARWIAVLV